MGIVSNLQRAKQIVHVYAELDPPQELEVVELTRGTAKAENETADFLGYDLSNGVISLLDAGLKLPESTNLPLDDLFTTLQPLFRMVEQCFRPRLNKNGLFDDYSDAQMCLQAMKALNKLYPGAYEHEDTMRTFEIIGVWHVYSLA